MLIESTYLYGICMLVLYVPSAAVFVVAIFVLSMSIVMARLGRFWLLLVSDPDAVRYSPTKHSWAFKFSVVVVDWIFSVWICSYRWLVFDSSS